MTDVQETTSGAQIIKTPTTESVRPSFDEVDIGDPSELMGVAVKADSQEQAPVGEEITDKTEGDAEETASDESEPVTPPPLPNKPQANRHKTIRAFYDEGDPLDIPAHYKVEHKVNGQPVVYTIQDLLDKSSGVDNLDRLYNEIKQKETQLGEYVTNFVKAVNEGAEKDPEKAVEAIYQLVSDNGGDPVSFHSNLTSSLLKSLATKGFITEDQYLAIEEARKPVEIQQENEYFKRKLEQQAKLQAEKEQQALQEKAKRETEAKLGMQVGQYDEIYNFLEAERQAGNIKVESILPEHIAEFHSSVKVREQVNAVIEKVSPDLSEDTETIETLTKAVYAFSPTAEELEEVLKELLGEKEDESSESEEEGEKESSSTERAVRSLSNKASKDQRQAPKAEEKTKERPKRSRAIEAWDDI